MTKGDKEEQIRRSFDRILTRGMLRVWRKKLEE